MTNAMNESQKILVIPCSGVGKVHGLVSREAVYHVTDELLPKQADTVCLALLVSGDEETVEKVKQIPCITLDGCPKLCAYKNVALSGGNIAKGIRVYDVMKRHRGANFGTATALSEEGWAVVKELAAEVAQTAEPMGKSIEE
ncbi:MAG: putative zinc-binding protein [Planctomycetaceae bacterium]|nr:putative zinc-binding protein [Planctomycetaceae bacterium]